MKEKERERGKNRAHEEIGETKGNEIVAAVHVQGGKSLPGDNGSEGGRGRREERRAAGSQAGRQAGVGMAFGSKGER